LSRRGRLSQFLAGRMNTLQLTTSQPPQLPRTTWFSDRHRPTTSVWVLLLVSPVFFDLLFLVLSFMWSCRAFFFPQLSWRNSSFFSQIAFPIDRPWWIYFVILLLGVAFCLTCSDRPFWSAFSFFLLDHSLTLPSPRLYLVTRARRSLRSWVVFLATFL